MAYKNMSYSNRGKFLENIIIMANKKYKNGDIADIRKVPTPVQITKDNGRTVEGRKEKGEWTDFAGIYEGRSILFDAKETKTLNLPIENIKPHQYEILKSWHEKGAHAFLVVYFHKPNKYYYLSFKTLEWAWERAKKGTRMSISLKEFETMAIEVKSNNGFTLDYLEAIR